MPSHFKSLCVASLLSLFPVAAGAADLSGNYNGSLKDGPGYGYFVVTIGGYAVVEPEFKGSKNYGFTGQPYFNVYRAGEDPGLSLPNDSMTLTLINAGAFRAGLAGNYESGRDRSDDETALRGLHDIDTTVLLGGYAEYWLTRSLRTRAEVLQAVNGHEGLLVNLMADFVYRPSPVWQLTLGPRLQVVNAQYNNEYFGIRTSEVLASGLPAYRAGGGLNSVGLEATAKYDISDRWSLRGFVGYQALVDDAADSPLVTLRGSEDQVRAGLGASYSFHVARDVLPF